MLNDTIAKYQALFTEAGIARDTTRCLALIEQMKQEFESNPPSVTEVVTALDDICNAGRSPSAEFILSAAWGNLSTDYTPALCRILDNPECNASHEQAVELLQQVGDERAVPVLTKAVDYRWDYDQWLHVPRKALQALAAIRTVEALAVVRTAMQSSDEAIREEAAALLEEG